VPAEFTQSGSDLEAFSHLLEFGLRMNLAQDMDGFASVRRTLKSDLRDAAWRHCLVQLEVASLARRLGVECCLEKGRGGLSASPSDVVLRPPQGEVVAEVKVVFLE
jgi:hypothetical protein